MRKGELVPRGILLATALTAVGLAGCQRPPETQSSSTPFSREGKPKEEAQLMFPQKESRLLWAPFRSQSPPLFEVDLPYPENYSEKDRVRVRGSEVWFSTGGGILDGGNIFNESIPPNMTLAAYLTAMKNIFPLSPKAQEIETRKMDGRDARILRDQLIDQDKPVGDVLFAAFINEGRGWRIWVSAPILKLSEKQKIFDQILSSFEFGQKVAKPAAPEKVAIRLKPEELFRALLTTPLQQNELPPGFTAKSKSAGTLDATAQTLKAIGQVNALVAENDPRFGGMPNGGISYTVFPDAANAKGAYDMFAKRSDSRTISDSPYPTAFFIEQSLFAKVSVCVVLVENTFIAATLTNIEQTPQETKTVQLAQAGITHLQKVGR